MLRNKLKSWRHRMEMDQTEFAAFLEVQRQLYNRWENQRSQPSLELALKVAQKIRQKLPCTVDDLFETPE